MRSAQIAPGISCDSVTASPLHGTAGARHINFLIPLFAMCSHTACLREVAGEPLIRFGYANVDGVAQVSLVVSRRASLATNQATFSLCPALCRG